MIRLTCLSFAVLIAGEATAQSSLIDQAASLDQVWLAPGRQTETSSRWYPRPVTTIAGRIVTLDDKQLAILVAGDQVPSRVAGDRVIWIRPGDMSEQETAALKLFAEGNHAAALRPLIDSLSQRPPVWRQQWLSMLAAFSAKKSSRGQIALELVSQLDARPLASYVIAWLPIAWENDRQAAASIAAARDRLDSDSAAVRLVAASWLLSSPARPQATEVLKRLAIDTKRPHLAQLAETVLWRTATPPQVTEQADRWLEKIDQLPMVLQTGPLITLQQKLESAGLARQAEKLKRSLELTPIMPFPIK